MWPLLRALPARLLSSMAAPRWATTAPRQSRSGHLPSWPRCSRPLLASNLDASWNVELETHLDAVAAAVGKEDSATREQALFQACARHAAAIGPAAVVAQADFGFDALGDSGNGAGKGATAHGHAPY